VAKPLTGRVTVDADPLPKFSAADRSARQLILMRIYESTKTLGDARVAVRSLVGQRDSIAADFGAGRADTLNTRIARLAADIDRALTAINGQRAPIEGWSGLPTADQQRALGFAVDDARKAVTELNKLIATDIPAAYRAVANKDWGRKVRAVAVPR
jgi:hypothetical protein